MKPISILLEKNNIPNVKLQYATEGIENLSLSVIEKEIISKKGTDKTTVHTSFEGQNTTVYIFLSVLNNEAKDLENSRRTANTVWAELKKYNISKAAIKSTANSAHTLAFLEGLALSNYTFQKYKSKPENALLEGVSVECETVTEVEIQKLNALIAGNYTARTLVNEPLSYLTATQFSKEMEAIGAASGFSVKVLEKKEIEALKMGGLLSVNLGSQLPPTFSILEWKPANAKNTKPYVLVGKGVVYDTGGLSLKPTPNSMDKMKCDMAGGAAVVGTLQALASAKIPVHVIGLIPATDNRPGENAYVPGDVITISDGTTVEVLNTDAEGRLILADALHYAKQYNPELVIDLATLTGAAVAAVGYQGCVLVGTASEQDKKQIAESGYAVHERTAEFPFWDEYAEMIKSDVADIKNTGGSEAGAITAGKFLQHFTNYPWIHLDIAGPAYITAPDSYRGKYGTGFGVRLLFDFLVKKAG